MFLIIALMTLSGEGTTAVASAIYSVYFLSILCLGVFLVFVRTRRVVPSQVTILIEAYVVALFITILLLFHNLFFPIPYFSSDAGVRSGVAVQLTIAFAYGLPGALYLGIQSWHAVRGRTKATRSIKHPDHLARLKEISIGLEREIVAWSVLHYVLIALLVWSVLFASATRMTVLDKALKGIKLLPTL